jgi:cellulose synthase/poly-beta-1,6-N-acetylglucosamine synthase-like glycosyltransferase
VGLSYAQGEYLVIYDAEDTPHPSQLRLAAFHFAAGPESLGCLQARLVIDNGREHWLSAALAAQYRLHFGAVLPLLARLGLAFPLSGSSNHFRVSALRAVHGWDAHNVTEDADLGLRLRRAGYRLGFLPSSTWEEAPAAFITWLRQRSRWMKGFLQTLCVHGQTPFRCIRRIGPGDGLAFLILVGGAVAAPLVAVPLVAVSIVSFVLDTHLPLARVGWGLGVCGAVSASLTGFLGVKDTLWRRLRAGLLAPLAWCVIVLASIRALYKAAIEPHRWEKTPHGSQARIQPDD